MKTLLLVGVLALASPVLAGWRADCRHAARQCRVTHAASITTTTTTLPIVTYYCHEQSVQCVRLSGLHGGDAEDTYCSLFNLIQGCKLSLPLSASPSP